MKNQVLSDAYIVKKITDYNHKHNRPVEYLGIHPSNAEELYGIYEGQGNHQVRSDCLLYGANIYYDDTILPGTIKVSREHLY